MHLKSGLEARFHHPFFLPSGLSSCEPRKRKPALFPASPSPQAFGLCTASSGKKAKTKAKTKAISFHKYKTLKPPIHSWVYLLAPEVHSPAPLRQAQAAGRYSPSLNGAQHSFYEALLHDEENRCGWEGCRYDGYHDHSEVRCVSGVHGGYDQGQSHLVVGLKGNQRP